SDASAVIGPRASRPASLLTAIRYERVWRPAVPLECVRPAPQILPHGAASVFGAEQTAALQLRHDHAAELLEHHREEVGHEDEAVAAASLEDLLHVVGDGRGRAHHHVARPPRRLGEADLLGGHDLEDPVGRTAMALVAG